MSATREKRVQVCLFMFDPELTLSPYSSSFRSLIDKEPRRSVWPVRMSLVSEAFSWLRHNIKEFRAFRTSLQFPTLIALANWTEF